MKKYDAVLFDMDGVLLRSEYAMKEAAVVTLRQYGINPVHEDFLPFTGMGEDKFIGGVAEKYGLVYRTEMKNAAYEIYGGQCRPLIETFKDIPELTAELKERGYLIAVASSADIVKVKINLSCIGIAAEDFNAVITGSDIKNKKPDPEIYLKAAEALGLKPSACVVAEDAIAGVKAALSAGMDCIGITSAFNSEALTAAGCFTTVSETRFIADILGAE